MRRVAYRVSRWRPVGIARWRSRKPRCVPLTEGGMAIFEKPAAGKLENQCLFSRADGSVWYRMVLVRAMRIACAGGKIIPTATSHARLFLMSSTSTVH